jgi:hypothetical protein
MAWVFHIIKIYILEYNVDKIQKQNYNSLHLWYYREFAQQYEYGNHYRSLYLFVLLKTLLKWQWNSMFCGNEIKTTK